MHVFMYLSLLALVNPALCFPHGRCYVKSCAASPYRIDVINSTCIKLVNIKSQCVDNTKYNCCNTLSNKLQKIVIKSKASCNTSIKSVFVNGINKGGGVYLDSYNIDSSELRITNLNLMNINSVDICLRLSSPCNTLESFCGPNCQISILDPSTHACCPTCDISFTADTPIVTPLAPIPPPPPPPPPPPSPKQPSPKSKLPPSQKTPPPASPKPSSPKSKLPPIPKPLLPKSYPPPPQLSPSPTCKDQICNCTCASCV